MNTETKQLRRSQIKGIVFCLVCMVAVYGMSCLASYILGRDVIANDSCLIGFMVVEMVFVVAVIALMFSPKVVLSVITRIANKKIEDQTGCNNAIDEVEKNESTIRAAISTCEVSAKVPERYKGLSQLLKYMKMIDKTVKTAEEFFKNAARKDFSRKYLNDITVLITDSQADEKSILCLRLLFAYVYDFADNHLTSREDSRARIENMRLLLSKFSILGDEKNNALMFYMLIFDIMCNAFEQQDYKSVVEAYGLMRGSCLHKAEVRSEQLSKMYNIVGVSKLYCRDKNAISYLKVALSYDPKNFFAACHVADYYYGRYDYVNAYEYAGRSFALLSDSEFSEGELNKIGDALSTVLYMSAFALGKLDEAYATVLMIDKRTGDDASIKGNRAYLAFKCGKYDEAEQCIKQAWELDPNKGSVLNVRGMLFLRKGKYSKAIKSFKEAIKYFKPSRDSSLERFFYGEICNNLAVALYKNSEQEAARKWFDKAMAVCYPDVAVDIIDALPPISCPCEKK